MNRQKMQRVFLLQTNTCLGATKLPDRQGVAAISQDHSGDNGLNRKLGICDGIELCDRCEPWLRGWRLLLFQMPVRTGRVEFPSPLIRVGKLSVSICRMIILKFSSRNAWGDRSESTIKPVSP